MFPFGIQPDAITAVPPDTVNRLILHGAHYHDRAAVFRSGGEGEERANPDWRIDRHSLRIALALRETRRLDRGGIALLEIPFGLELLLLERAVWSLGAASSFDPSRRADVVVDGAWVPALLEHGAVLDTPERASKLRETARDVSPRSLASIEPDGEERTQSTWVRDIEAFLLGAPPRRGARRVLERRVSLLDSRIAAYAGWADGLTETVLGLE